MESNTEIGVVEQIFWEYGRTTGYVLQILFLKTVVDWGEGWIVIF